DDRHESTLCADSAERSLQISDIALKLRHSRIPDFAADRPFQTGARDVLVVLAIELSKSLPVLPDEVGLVRADRPALDPGEPFDDIAIPMGLAVFAVIDDIEAELRLLPHHLL